MILGIYSNTDRDIDGKLALLFVSKLRSGGLDYLITDTLKAYSNEKTYSLAQVIKSADVMVVFGGDGTILDVSGKCSPKGVPILGVNLGYLGFLTDCDEKDLDAIAVNLKNGDYTIDERTMLASVIEGKDYIALNEIIVGKCENMHISSLTVTIDGRVADTVNGDGIMVSTPTGSTAYNMACGGAILEPSVNAFIITAICPHTLHSRPIVVPDDSEIKLCAKNNHDAVLAIFDGVKIYSSTNELCVTVKKSPIKAKFVRFTEQNFYKRLLRKLKYWR